MREILQQVLVLMKMSNVRFVHPSFVPRPTGVESRTGIGYPSMVPLVQNGFANIISKGSFSIGIRICLF